MQINFEIEANDFLIHQLYIASISERTKKKRKRSWLMPAIIYIIIGTAGYLSGDKVFSLIMLIIAIIWVALYPVWERNYYYTHYRDFIQEHYKDRFNTPVSIKFEKNLLVSRDSGSESKLLYSELEEVVEIPTVFLLKIKGGLAFIIPKREINIPEFKTMVTQLSNDLNIKHTIDNNWKWK